MVLIGALDLQFTEFSVARIRGRVSSNIGAANLVGDSVAWLCRSDATRARWHGIRRLPVPGKQVAAPLIGECYANFECKLFGGRLVGKWGLFIWEVVKAHAATSPKYPETFHYRGNGVFMISGRSISLRRKFKPEML